MSNKIFNKTIGWWARYGLIGLLIVATVWDIGTFVYGWAWHIYETNPIYIFTKNIGLLLSLKILVVAFSSYYVHKMVYSNTSRTMRYMVIVAIMWGIIGQGIGGYMNVTTKKEVSVPTETNVMPPSEAVRSYASIVVLPYLYLFVLSVGSFKVWEWMEYY